MSAQRDHVVARAAHEGAGLDTGGRIAYNETVSRPGEGFSSLAWLAKAGLRAARARNAIPVDGSPARGHGPPPTLTRIPYRIIVTQAEHRTSIAIDLPRTPDVGDEVALANGERVVVRQVMSSGEPEYAGLILAATL